MSISKAEVVNIEDHLDSSDARLLESLRRHGGEGAQVAVVLGSGLGGFAEALDNPKSIPYGELDGMPESRVPGHSGRLLLGELDGVKLIVQQGRVHLYEGCPARTVSRAVRAFAGLGCGACLLTNAAGGLVPEWGPGTLMRITDQINYQGQSSLQNFERSGTSPYDSELGSRLDQAAQAQGMELKSGVYCSVTGPSYETPAEIRMLRWMGAHAVGMSTAIEASAASAAGMRVVGVSCITNHAAGISQSPLSHDEVIAAGAEAAGRFEALLRCAISIFRDS